MFGVCRDDGKISKTLSLQRFDQGGDWFLQLSVQDSINKDGSMKIGLPITGSELYTLKTLAEVTAPAPLLIRRLCRLQAAPPFTWVLKVLCSLHNH